MIIEQKWSKDGVIMEQKLNDNRHQAELTTPNKRGGRSSLSWFAPPTGPMLAGKPPVLIHTGQAVCQRELSQDIKLIKLWWCGEVLVYYTPIRMQSLLPFARERAAERGRALNFG